ncbi:MAG: hypothetical protein II944_01505 [Ruminobacter sp.]|jgi:hypothetical protein|nr:hypothetical protein [Ruminobacter sp.]
MQQKNVFITALDKNEQIIQQVYATVKKYGMNAVGHFWNYDEPELTKKIPGREFEVADAWVIIVNDQQIPPEVMFGLSVMGLILRLRAKYRVPVLVVGKEQHLSEVFKDVEFFSVDNFGTKLVSKTAIKKQWSDYGFNISVHNQTGIGLWFEIGPNAETEWNGVFLGVDTCLDGYIDFQAVGPAGAMPERTTLNYPFKDAKLELNGKEYTAWGCSNVLKKGDSFYVRIKGIIPSIIIGEGLGDGDSTECRVFRLMV